MIKEEEFKRIHVYHIDFQEQITLWFSGKQNIIWHGKQCNNVFRVKKELIMKEKNLKANIFFEMWILLFQVLWTDRPCKNFHLLICLAVLDTEKSTLIENNFGFTEILKVSFQKGLSLSLSLFLSLCPLNTHVNWFFKSLDH